MKQFFIVALILALLGCESQSQKVRAYREKPVQLKTNNQKLVQLFDSCLTITKSLIKQRVTESEFNRYFALNTRATGFEYKYIVRHISDTLTDFPKGYQVFYDFIIDKDTLSSFRADFDSTLEVTYYRYYHLLAFRKFIDKELTITKKAADKIAIRNGVSRKDLESIFMCSEEYPDTTKSQSVRFFWESKSGCNGCKYVTIDAKTGKITEEGRTVHTF